MVKKQLDFTWLWVFMNIYVLIMHFLAYGADSVMVTLKYWDEILQKLIGDFIQNGRSGEVVLTCQ